MEIFPPPLLDAGPFPAPARQIVTAPVRQIAEHIHSRTLAGLTLSQAIDDFVEKAKAYCLPDDLETALQGAMQRRHGKSRISAQTLRNWFHAAYPTYVEDRRRMAYVLYYLQFGDGVVARLFHVTTRTVRKWRRAG